MASLDGYVADSAGGFDWAAPDDEVHAFVNDLERPVGTYLFGRRMYQTMKFWQTVDTGSDQREVARDYAAIWRAADKIVFSTTLGEVSTPRTRLEREFDPEAVRRLVASTDRGVSVGGPGLAAHAIRAGLVDEYHLVVVPVIVGGGTPWLPADVRLGLALQDVHRFASGSVYLRYVPTGRVP
jgi:dihydrofolate reductase